MMAKTDPLSASRIDPPVPSPGGDTEAPDITVARLQMLAKRVTCTEVHDGVLCESCRSGGVGCLRAWAINGNWPTDEASGILASQRATFDSENTAAEERIAAAVSSSSVADSPTIVLPTKAEVEAEGFEAVPVDDEPSAASASAEADT